MTERTSRRLAAILAADVAGYTRLVQQDEEGTIAAWQARRTDVIDPAIERHGGRIANTAGDSILVEFRSAVDAARCALEIQSGMAERAATGPKIALRIGVTVGDVISDGDDLLGDGVNIAARLEQLAEPGRVLASGAFADQVRGRADVTFRPMGAKRLKNVADAVEVFALLPKDAQISAPRRSRLPVLSLLVVVLLMMAGGLVWWHPWHPDMPPAQPERMAYPLPDKPSVAVLPFRDLTEQSGFLADGLTDDLITDLSKIAGLFVIAGNSSFAMRGKDMTVSEFAEAVGVRYVIDGSIRRTGDTLRVNTRLVDTTNGQLVWAERYDGRVEDVFDVQTKVVMAVTSELHLTVSDTEMDQIKQVDTQKVEAREAFQRGWDLYSRLNEHDNTGSIPHFERAIALDPDYGRAYAALALAHLRPNIFHHWNAFTGDGQQLHIEQFNTYFKMAMQYETSLLHVIQAMVYLNWNDMRIPPDGVSRDEGARVEAARAIALSPNDPEAHIVMAWALIAGGEPQEGLNFVDAAMRLNPNYPSHYVLLRAAAYFALDDLDMASAVLAEELQRRPQATELLPMAASILALNGQYREARNMVDLWWQGGNSAALNAQVGDQFFMVRWVDAQNPLNLRLKEGLELAALPAGTTVTSLRNDLTGPDAPAQIAAARALSLFGAAAAPAVPELITAFETGNARLRREVAIALGRIGPGASAAIPVLQAADDGSLIGAHARRALGLIEATAPGDP